MNLWRASKAAPIAIALLLLGLSASAAPISAAQDEDLAAITKVVRGIIDVTNNPSMAKANADELRRALGRFYAKDDDLGMRNGALFFGPTSQPVSRGTAQYVDNIVTNLLYYRSLGAAFKIEINELQVSSSGSLGVATARTTSVVTAANGAVVSIPGRWTAVFDRNSEGRWMVSHEHLSFFGPNSGGSMPLETMRDPKR